ncbi:MAG TPA: T9SS type A sorting domain-containing protein, partial [Bacteroidia bacterium]|nr:T9SS type A sorting domain-containing protein [Bacteroidia bacterium]
AGGQPNVMLGFTYYNGYASTTNGYVAVGMAVDNISVYAPAAYDLGVASQNLPFLMQVGKPYTFTGTINNYGGDSIVSMNVNYSVNHGPVQVDNVTGITGFNGLTTFNFSHNIPFTPSATGNYSVRFWADNLNSGNVDSKHSNDTLVASFMAVDTVQPKSVLYEEGTGQSCVYCMLAGPNLDSVAPVVKPYCNIISYHVPIPSAPDYMYQVTSPTTDTRANYYGVYSNGTPDGFMDGWNNLYPGALAAPNDFSTPVIAQEAAAGSPFKINISTCTYATNTQTYNITASITAYGPFAAGLTAQVALIADSITYTQDYSADDPTASFAPPIGSSSGGSYPGAPDYLYEYTMKFPHVAEQMLPTGNGTTLSSFTAGQTQTLNLSWKSTHPLSYKPNTYPYDSSSTMHMVVFVQTNTGLAAAGVPAKFVYQSASALVSNIVGIDEVKNEVGFNMYPNPSRGNTTIVYSLNKTQQVTIEVYDMFGQKVYVANNGQVAAGEHTININSQQFQSGVYTVVFRTDGGVSTQKLIIQQ